MQCNYREKFNNSQSILMVNESGYDILFRIHKFLFGEYYDNLEFVIRYNDLETIELINNCVKNILSIKLSDDKELIAKTIAKNISTLYFLQPFVDGNTRTLYLFLKLFFGLHYNVDNWHLDETIINKIPFYSIYYSLDDEPTLTNIAYIADKLTLTKKTF